MRNRFLLPSLAILVGTSAAQAADLGIQIHGFASQGYVETDGDYYADGWYGRDTNSAGTFEFNEFAVNVMANPIDSLRIGVQLSAYDLGKYGNDEVAIDWAFGELQVATGVDWLSTSVVAGRFKTGHGLYNDYRDLDVSRTSVFLPRSTYSPSFRDFFLAANGAQLNGTIDAGKAGSFTLSAFLGTQNFDNDEGVVYDTFGSPFNGPSTSPLPGSTNVLSSFDSISLEKMAGGYLNWDTPIDGLRLKGSTLYADKWEAEGTLITYLPPVGPLGPFNGSPLLSQVNVDVDHWFDIMAGAEWQISDLTLMGEVSSSYFTANITVTGAPNINLAQRTLGTYFAANYQLSFLPGNWKRLSVYGAGMWSRLTTVSADPDSKNYTRSGAIAVRYDIVDHLLVKAEFERIQDTDAGESHVYGNIFSFKTTFDF
jgi:hypothetical protein